MKHDANDHPEERRRVRSKIGRYVLGFVFARYTGRAPEFTARDLEIRIDDLCRLNGSGYSFGSATRILRDLRSAGWIDYEITNRARSQYRLLWMRDYYIESNPNASISDVYTRMVLAESGEILYFTSEPETPAEEPLTGEL